MDDAPRILVAEDDRVLRDAIAGALRQEGYEVRSTSDSERASKLVTGLRPDLAVLDVRFPEGPDGFELAGEIRAVSDAPIIFVTADGNAPSASSPGRVRSHHRRDSPRTSSMTRTTAVKPKPGQTLHRSPVRAVGATEPAVSRERPTTGP